MTTEHEEQYYQSGRTPTFHEDEESLKESQLLKEEEQSNYASPTPALKAKTRDCQGEHCEHIEIEN